MMKSLALFFMALAISATAQTNAWKRVTVSAVQGNLGLNTKCTINGKWAFIQGLSPDVVAAYNEVTRLDKEVNYLSAWIKNETKRIRDAQARGPQEAPFGSPAGNYIRQLNIDARKLEEKQEDLAAKMDSLKDATAKFKELSQIEAVETKLSYNGMSVWVARKSINNK